MTNNDPRPLLFISHRHADRQIADVLRRFLSGRSLGKISVFQSSSVGHTLEIGKNINQQLMEKLDKANPIVLLYTTTDQDWSYCMWECGIATNPTSPQNTRIIVLHATAFFPTLFADRVRVNIQNQGDLQTFVRAFLTDPCFFPELGQAIAPDIEPNGSEVRDATEELYQKFQEVIPPLQEPPEEWSAWPFLQLELSLEYVDRIRKTQPEQRFQVASAVIQESCLISAGDGEAQRLFGMAGFPKGMAFKTLIEIWKEKNPQSEPKWLASICTQLISGVQWRLPDLTWALIKGVNSVWYVPVLNCVRKITTQNCIQFDIYFYKFDVASQSQSTEYKFRETS